MAAFSTTRLTNRVTYSKWKVFRKNVRLHWQLLVFMALPITYLILFKYMPMIGVQIAFRKFTITGGIWNSEWVGLDQFIKFFHSYQFARVLPNTLRISFYSLIAGFPFPIILALSLNAMQSARYRKVIQTVTYIPHFISIVVLVGMIIAIMNPRSGMYGTLVKAITGVEPEDLLAKSEVFPHLYVWSDIWQNMGWR